MNFHEFRWIRIQQRWTISRKKIMMMTHRANQVSFQVVFWLVGTVHLSASSLFSANTELVTPNSKSTELNSKRDSNGRRQRTYSRDADVSECDLIIYATITLQLCNDNAITLELTFVLLFRNNYVVVDYVIPLKWPFFTIT